MTTMIPMLAYIGPGGAFGAIGSAIALIGAIILALVGFVWYPLKRFLRGRKNAAETSDRGTSDSTAAAAGSEDQRA